MYLPRSSVQKTVSGAGGACQIDNKLPMLMLNRMFTVPHLSINVPRRMGNHHARQPTIRPHSRPSSISAKITPRRLVEIRHGSRPHPYLESARVQASARRDAGRLFPRASPTTATGSCASEALVSAVVWWAQRAGRGLSNSPTGTTKTSANKRPSAN